MLTWHSVLWAVVVWAVILLIALAWLVGIWACARVKARFADRMYASTR